MSADPFIDRGVIDTLVDDRRTTYPEDVGPIYVPLTPLEVHTALALPIPHGSHPLPDHCAYRGYRIQCLRNLRSNP